VFEDKRGRTKTSHFSFEIRMSTVNNAPNTFLPLGMREFVMRMSQEYTRRSGKTNESRAASFNPRNRCYADGSGATVEDGDIRRVFHTLVTLAIALLRGVSEIRCNVHQ